MSAPKKSGWGGFLSGAVAGLESRLDTILAEDDQASQRTRAAEEAARQAKLQEKNLSRSSSNRGPNRRLEERLAKAIVKGERSGSRPPTEQSSAAVSPALAPDTARSSLDSRASEAVLDTKELTLATNGDTKHAMPDKTEENGKEVPEQGGPNQTDAVKDPVNPTELAEAKPAASPRPSVDSTRSRTSLDLAGQPRPSQDVSSRPTVQRTPSAYESEIEQMRQQHEETARQQREEISTHLERIDALQAKLQYLANQALEQAQQAAADATNGSLEQKLAEKDQQIAQLMDEGQKLSKTELKYMNTIKKMRAKSQQDEKSTTQLKARLAKAEKDVVETTERARKAEATEKTADEKLKQIGRIEKDIDALRVEREAASLTIGELRRQLADAVSRAEDAESRAQSNALGAEKKITSDLKEQLEDLRLEKKLAEDRAKTEVRQAKEEAERQKEKASMTEMELKGELANLETKLEVLRAQTEEVSSSATGDGQAKLLRQIETLQTQYALARENWQGIEGTLTSRVAALEKERDEISKRENDIRRKAREVNSKARRAEEELETRQDQVNMLEEDLQEHKQQLERLQARLVKAEQALEDARADLEKERKLRDMEVSQRIEEEKMKWRTEMQNNHQVQDQNSYLRAESPTASNSHRKHSASDLLSYSARRNLGRSISGTDMTMSPTMLNDHQSRPQSSSRNSVNRTPDLFSPTPPTRQDSTPSLPQLKTPSIHTLNENDETFERSSSPHRTINDMISIGTINAGPSVQLVERLSTAVRRLESEKATYKDELARLTQQRDGAREEVVQLMREIEEKRSLGEKVGNLEKELEEMKQRYETTLEMLGEKSEEVEELRMDVGDLKRIYRELVETTIK